jgi:cytochrome P450
MLPIDDVIDQIPHWVFPIAGLFSVHLPRLLVLLGNHPKELSNVVDEIKEITVPTRESYVRKCILELFRLNNAVNSTFRGLTESFIFENYDETFEAGTQFVFFNNPVLRDLFDYPNEYKPGRWNPELEESYRALMFNQGNQKCPGKELVLSLIGIGLKCYLEKNNYRINTNIKLDPSFIPYILNPCTITFD